MTSVDWAGLQKTAEDGGAVPDGEYDVRVASSKVEKTKKQPPKDMITVKFEVVTGPKAGAPIYNNFVLSPENANALTFFFRHMAVLGLDQTWFSQQPSLEQTAEALVGRYATIEVGHREYNGVTRNQVGSIKPYAGAPAAPAAPAGLPAPAAAPTPPPVPAQTLPAPAAAPIAPPVPTGPPVPPPPPAQTTPGDGSVPF